MRSLGEFEMLVLAALMRLDRDAYGVEIREFLEAEANRRVAAGALYTTLSRMEDKGLVASRTGEATPERGGKARRYYHPTAEGKAALRDSVGVLGRLTRGLL